MPLLPPVPGYQEGLTWVRDPVGRLLDGPERRQWRIYSLDAGYELDMEGVFRPREGVSVEARAVLATTQGANDQGEVVQFLGGASDRVKVTVELYAETPGDDISPDVEQLLGLVRKDAKLKRCPVVRFAWGEHLARDVMAEGVSLEVRRLWPNGRYAEVGVALSLVEVASVEVEISEPGLPEPESTEVVLRAGETFEELARRFYGDPLKGVTLRQRHSASILEGVEVAGAAVLVVGREHSEVAAPAAFVSLAFAAGDDLDAVLGEVVAARSAAREVPD